MARHRDRRPGEADPLLDRPDVRSDEAAAPDRLVDRRRSRRTQRGDHVAVGATDAPDDDVALHHDLPDCTVRPTIRSSDVIIDCHGHYTTAPAQLGEYRDAQRAALADDPDHVGDKGVISISDDEIRASLEGAQVRLQQERGIDLTLFSPRASWMGHHLGNVHTSRFWTEHCNELIRRVCDLYPQRFAPVCQLPQSPGAPIEPVGRRAANGA